MLNADFTREHRFLNAKKGLLPEDIEKGIDNKSIRLIDSDITHTKEISSASSTASLLLSTNDKEVGISDFAGNRLEAGVNAAIGRIKVGYGKAAAISNPTGASIAYSSDIEAFPEALLRAKLIVIQDGKVIMRLPVERFTVAAKSQKTQGEEDVLHLGAPFLLIQQKEIKIELEFGPDQAMVPGDDKHFLQTRFIGVETASR